MPPNSSLIFLLQREPTQGAVGKVGYKASRAREVEDHLYFDFYETVDGLTMTATVSDEPQWDEEDDKEDR